MERYLEIAAIVSATFVFALLLVSLVRSGQPRQVQVLRFRRGLRRLDDVSARWAMELQARPAPAPAPHPADEVAVDPRRHPRRPGQHP